MICLKPLRNEKFVARVQKKKLPIRVEKKKVGSGSYNIVYRASVSPPCKDIGKKIIFRRSKDSIDNVRLFNQEVKMAIKMAEAQAGPEVYRAGLDTQERGFMIMEHYPSSLRQLMDLQSNKRPKWSDIERGLRIPIKKMADAGIFCSDLKFRNVVIRGNSASSWVMKLIDFGDDFCAFRDDIIIPDKYLDPYHKKIAAGKMKKMNMSNILYGAMLMMMSINSEKTRNRVYGAKTPSLFAREIQKLPIETKLIALILIGQGKSKNGMAKPISQARHYYKGTIVNADKIYEILTGDTLKK
ncbi:MAG: hypothetical protein CMM25_08035 [Rhodospirillaceae bacterium]|nr:hypothetical protein [Rhodospirillaceae bacterium]|tara:strand:+ start:640 stop:1533 length:894 start_codon:yes stop_codon:yes gene_type:complete